MPISPKPAWELKIQYRMLGRCSTYRREVGVEQDVGGAGAGELAVEGQAELLDDARAGAVEAEQVAGALGEDLAGAAVAEA